MSKLIIKILSIFVFSLSLCGVERVVSLSPQLTEIVFYLQGEGALVGRSSACSYPLEAKDIPVVGDFANPFLERLLAVKPSIVIANSIMDQNKINFIEKAKIKYFKFDNNNFNDYLKCVETLGVILDKKEQSTKEISRFSRFIKEQSRKKFSYRPKVLLLLNDKPLVSAGAKSFITDLITLAGGENVSAVEDKDYFVCSLEWVIRQNVDILIAPKELFSSLEDMRKRQGWMQISAVKNGRVICDFDQDLILRLGPRSIEGIKFLQKKFTEFK